MKAAVVKDKGRFSIEEVPDPTPGPGEVVFKVSYCAVCGSDLDSFASGRGTGLILGHELCGRIAEVGEGVQGWAPGDRVVVEPITQCGACFWCVNEQGNLCPHRAGTGMAGNPGGYAEYAKAGTVQLFHAPEGVGEKESTMAQCLAVGLHALHLSDLKLGEKVIVIGAGPVGLMVLACARAAGAGKIYVVEKAEGRKKAAAQLGADAVFDPTNAEYREQLSDLVGIGADLVFSCAGSGQAVQDALSFPRAGGMIVTVGNHWKAELTSDIVDREITVKGSKAYCRREFGEAVDLIASGMIKSASMITDVEPLDNIQQAFDTLRNPTTQVKTLIAP